MAQLPYREKLVEFIRLNAKPVDKFSHQARLYARAHELAEGQPHDDDVIFAAAWLHDLGVFIGHRPEDPQQLATWDCVAYAMQQTPGLLKTFGFPLDKIDAVLEVIRTHQPSAEPKSFEAIVIRDADILEQLGSVGILRTVSKVGRDTRFIRFSDALAVLRRNLEDLPPKLKLERSRELAQPRIEILRSFLAATTVESNGLQW